MDNASAKDQFIDLMGRLFDEGETAAQRALAAGLRPEQRSWSAIVDQRDPKTQRAVIVFTTDDGVLRRVHA